MRGKIVLFRLMISVLMLSVLWNACAQGVRTDVEGDIASYKLNPEIDPFLLGNHSLEEHPFIDFELPNAEPDSDVIGLRFQPEQDPNIYLTWSHRLDKERTAELGWSINYQTVVTFKYNHVFSIANK